MLVAHARCPHSDRGRNAAQMAEWVRLADRQIETLMRERDQLDSAIAELRDTRNDVADRLPDADPSPGDAEKSSI